MIVREMIYGFDQILKVVSDPNQVEKHWSVGTSTFGYSYVLGVIPRVWLHDS